MGEAVDSIPSILNKCLFVSPDGQTQGEKQYVSRPLQGGDIMMSEYLDNKKNCVCPIIAQS